MKLLKNTTLLFIAFTFILTASCKKYPDGPLLSLRTKEHRVIGEWNVEYFSINGYDSTEYLKGQPLFGTYFFEKEDGRHIFGYISNDRLHSVGGKWEFRSNKKNIEIDIDHTSYTWVNFNLVIFSITKKTLWQIQRLTEKEMWLKGTYTDGREYFIKLELKSNL
jgi:hypothetical protein